MKKNKKHYSNKLDHEEEELLSSFEKDEWKTVKDVEKEKSSAQKAAVKTFAHRCTH